jgi:hypothetical protein
MVRFTIGFPLKKELVDDWEFITQKYVIFPVAYPDATWQLHTFADGSYLAFLAKLTPTLYNLPWTHI